MIWPQQVLLQAHHLRKNLIRVFGVRPSARCLRKTRESDTSIQVAIRESAYTVDQISPLLVGLVLIPRDSKLASLQMG